VTASGIFVFLLAAVIIYVSCRDRLTPPDLQAQKIMAVFREARQSAAAEGETMRVEIDLADNLVRLIDENRSETADDDRAVKSVPLLTAKEVKFSTRPQNIATTPTEIMPVPLAQFRRSKYPASASHNVFTFRFMPNGTIYNEGTDTIGANATTVGLTLYVWEPKFTNSNESETARAITVIGGTGSVRFWEYKYNLSEPNKWKESERVSFKANEKNDL
jgi:hypothetical protein